jgi:hypothetical protein
LNERIRKLREQIEFKQNRMDYHNKPTDEDFAEYTRLGAEKEELETKLITASLEQEKRQREEDEKDRSERQARAANNHATPNATQTYIDERNAKAEEEMIKNGTHRKNADGKLVWVGPRSS